MIHRELILGQLFFCVFAEEFLCHKISKIEDQSLVTISFLLLSIVSSSSPPGPRQSPVRPQLNMQPPPPPPPPPGVNVAPSSLAPPPPAASLQTMNGSMEKRMSVSSTTSSTSYTTTTASSTTASVTNTLNTTSVGTNSSVHKESSFEQTAMAPSMSNIAPSSSSEVGHASIDQGESDHALFQKNLIMGEALIRRAVELNVQAESQRSYDMYKKAFKFLITALKQAPTQLERDRLYQQNQQYMKE